MAISPNGASLTALERTLASFIALLVTALMLATLLRAPSEPVAPQLGSATMIVWIAGSARDVIVRTCGNAGVSRQPRRDNVFGMECRMT